MADEIDGLPRTRVLNVHVPRQLLEEMERYCDTNMIPKTYFTRLAIEYYLKIVKQDFKRPEEM